jgi:hypothetical protein
VDFLQPPALQARNFQTDGIRSDVDGGKGGHGVTIEGEPSVVSHRG